MNKGKKINHIQESASKQPETAMFTPFSFTWAVAILFHQAHQRNMVVFEVQEFVLCLSALLTLFKPASFQRFFLMISVQIWQVSIELPWPSNHWLFMALANVTILVSGVFCAVKCRTNFQTDLYKTFTPLLRIEMIILYFFATLHKINYDFLNPELSSAGAMFSVLIKRFQIGLPFTFNFPVYDWASMASIYGTLLIEGGLPILLCFSRTRLGASIFGILFHLALGISGFWDFSSVMLALYMLFLPKDTVRYFLLCKARYSWLNILLTEIYTLFSKASVQILSIIILLLHIALPYIPNLSVYEAGWYVKKTYLLLWFAFNVTVVGILILCIIHGLRSKYQKSFFKVRSPILLACPLLIFFNGMNPYLGLKTETSFSMFSNLQTEKDQWNHCFLPQWFRVFPYQDNLVSITKTSIPILQKAILQDYRLVYTEFLSITSQTIHQDDHVTYEYKGKHHEVVRIGDDPVLSGPLSLFKRKYFAFRNVKRPGKNTMSH